MGIVHHSNHARYLERGRIELLRLVGLDYTGFIRQGLHVPVTDLSISYKKPLSFDEVLMIETAISAVSKTRLSFAYRIFTGADLAPAVVSTEAVAGHPAVVAETHHCCVNESGRPVKMNDTVYETFLRLGAL